MPTLNILSFHFLTSNRQATHLRFLEMNLDNLQEQATVTEALETASSDKDNGSENNQQKHAS